MEQSSLRNSLCNMIIEFYKLYLRFAPSTPNNPLHTHTSPASHPHIIPHPPLQEEEVHSTTASDPDAPRYKRTITGTIAPWHVHHVISSLTSHTAATPERLLLDTLPGTQPLNTTAVAIPEQPRSTTPDPARRSVDDDPTVEPARKQPRARGRVLGRSGSR